MPLSWLTILRFKKYMSPLKFINERHYLLRPHLKYTNHRPLIEEIPTRPKPSATYTETLFISIPRKLAILVLTSRTYMPWDSRPTIEIHALPKIPSPFTVDKGMIKTFLFSSITHTHTHKGFIYLLLLFIFFVIFLC